MRRLVLLFVFSAAAMTLVFAQKSEKKDPLSELTSLKLWEVPFIPPSVLDTVATPDTLFLDLKKGAKEGEWVLDHIVFNDEPLFALSFTLRHDSLMNFDSISVVGTRIDFFQTKMVNKPTNVPNTVTVGLFSALSPQAPPLTPGRGSVMKMYFTAPPSRPISIRSVAPINMPPGLEFVTPEGGPIHPVVVRIGDAGTPAPEKKPAKPATSSKTKRKG